MIEFSTIDIDKIPDGHPVSDFSRFWHAKTIEASPFPWSEFEPMDVPRVLPWMLVIDCLPSGDYQYRLCGSGCDDLLKVNLTGKKFGAEVDKTWAKTQLQVFDSVRSGGQPVFSNGYLPVPGRGHVRVFRGLFGFSLEGRGIDKLVAVLAPDRRQPRESSSVVSLPLQKERRSQ